jgi:CBS domain containing-hemolysin-like protein
LNEFAPVFAIAVSTLLLSALVSGAVSAVANVRRMKRAGILSAEDAEIPGAGLVERARPVLIALSIAYVGFAAASVVSIYLVASARLSNWTALASTVGWLLLVVLFSVLAKALALGGALGYLRAVTGFVWALHIVLRPFTRVVEMLADRIAPQLWSLDLAPPLSGVEIREILEDEDASEFMEGEEVNWARSIFELGDTEIREIMVPRIDMVGIDVSTGFADALPIAAASRFTRLPVYEGNPDRILGLLHTKDMLSASVRGEQPTIRQLLRPVHFLPESKPIDEALAEFREGRIHLAVVVDEYGGTAGIVALEDILEEIVGEIRDEFDQEGELLRPIDEHAVIIDPRINIDDLNEALGLQLPTDEIDTLGGLLYQIAGSVPSRGDRLDHEDLEFTIDRVERQRIRQVTLRSARVLGAGHTGDDSEPSTEVSA